MRRAKVLSRLPDQVLVGVGVKLARLAQEAILGCAAAGRCGRLAIGLACPPLVSS
jgi:hypothetical protein